MIEEADVGTKQLWDVAKLGGILRGARYGAQIETRSDLLVAIERRTGYEVSENTIADVENGKRLPSLNTLTAIMLTLGVGFQDLASAMPEEHRDSYRRLSR